MDHRARIARFEQLLSRAAAPSDDEGTASANPVEGGKLHLREEIKQMALAGIPDQPASLRPGTYHHLLNLSPPSTLLTQYTAFVEEIASRVAALPTPALDSPPNRSDKLLREIERDVNRTFGGLAWFGGVPTTGLVVEEEDSLWKRLAMLDDLDRDKARSLASRSSSRSPSLSKGSEPGFDSTPTSPPPSLSLVPPAETGETSGDVSVPATPTTPTASNNYGLPAVTPHPRSRREVLLRPLYVYATLNPGLSYVQGMNSIAAVFFWIFAAHGPEAEAEASTFFALGAILSQLRDLYVPSLDGTSSPRASSSGGTSTPTGLGATLARFTSLLTWLDPAVGSALLTKEIDPALYVFRWLTTLFANEFQLPDLVRIWDRVISLYPSEDEPTAMEALSPILGHLIDISLGMVLLERPTIVSPYSSFQKVVTVLQDPQIDGEQVEKLMGIAWDIRDRRLGKSKRTSVSSDAGASPNNANWRSAANKWAAAASAAATTASTSSTANSLRQRFWSTSTSSSSSPRPASLTPSAAAEFDLDETASTADSETSVSTSGGSQLFASRGQRIGTPQRPSIAEEVTTIDGKVLPPPPDRIDQQQTLAQLIEAEMPREEDRDDGVDSDDDEGPTLRDRAATSWGGWKASLSKLAASDAAAQLSKRTTNFTIAASMQASSLGQSTARLSTSDAAAQLSKTTTNLSIQAQLLRDQLAEQGPERLAKIKESVSGASGRLLASTASERGQWRSGDPYEEPFTPPRWSTYDPHGTGRARAPSSPGLPPFATPDALGSPSASDMARTGSGGVKPLLLSGSVRRAANGSVDAISPPSSKRNSLVFGSGRSPSVSPTTLRSPLPHLADLAPPLSASLSRANSRGGHGRSASSYSPQASSPATSFHSRSASTAPLSSSAYAASSLEDVPIHSLRIQPIHESPTQRRRSLAQRDESPSPNQDNYSASTPATNGRGWSLSDAPVRAPPAPLEMSFDPNEVEDGGNDNASQAPAPASALVEPSSPDQAIQDMFAAADAREQEQSPAARPPRKSSLAGPTTSPPPRSSSLEPAVSTPPTLDTVNTAPLASPEDTPLSPASDSLARGTKITRRPPATRKRTSRAGSSHSVDLSREDRKAVSSFLAGKTPSSGGDDGTTSPSSGGSLSRRSSTTSRHTKRSSMSALPTGSNRQSVAGWDEADLLDAYGEEDEEQTTKQ